MFLKLFLLPYLLIIGYEDFRKKTISVWMLLIMLLIVPILKYLDFIRFEEKINLRDIIATIIFTVILLLFCKITSSLGVADAFVLGIVSVAIGIFNAIVVFMLSLLFVSIFSLCLLALQKIKPKDTIAFVPFIFLAYIGVLI